MVFGAPGRCGTSGKNQPKMMVEKPNTLSHASLQREPTAEMRVLESADIFRGATEIMIRHDGVVYRMKITRQGKLILNK
nr:hemin uptake protein HemP [Rhizobium cauense]